MQLPQRKRWQVRALYWPNSWQVQLLGPNVGVIYVETVKHDVYGTYLSFTAASSARIWRVAFYMQGESERDKVASKLIAGI